MADVAEVVEVLMQLTVRHTLNVRFINLTTPQTATIVRGGVTVKVAAFVPEGSTFGSIVCSGVTDVASRPAAASISGVDSDNSGAVRLSLPLIIMGHPDKVAGPEVTAALERVEDALLSIGRLIRWRFDVAGGEAVLGPMEIFLESEEGPIDLYQVPAAYFGDDQSTIANDGFAELSELSLHGGEEPLGHQLLREAWDLKYSNPRSSIVIGVSAAEVGLKRLIVDLAPVTRWLMEELPSPPLVAMMTRYLPELEIRAPIPRESRCPKGLRKSLHEAVEARNRVVHRG